MNIPQVAVFDLGKVLVEFDYDIATANIARRAGRSQAELRRLIDQSPLLMRLESGRISNQEFFDEVQRAIDYPGAYPEFAGLFANIFEPIPEMLALQAQLRARGVPTYIFSNTNGFAIDHIRARFPFFSQFDDYILSYEHGAMKPEARLYEVVEEKSGRSGHEVLYIDDRPENVVAGRQRGWKVIEHTDPAETRRQMVAFGILG